MGEAKRLPLFFGKKMNIQLVKKLKLCYNKQE